MSSGMREKTKCACPRPGDHNYQPMVINDYDSQNGTPGSVIKAMIFTVQGDLHTVKCDERKYGRLNGGYIGVLTFQT